MNLTFGIVLFIFIVLAKIGYSDRTCPTGTLEYGSGSDIICCKPVHECPEGLYVSQCTTNLTRDSCVKCPGGKILNFQSSSFDPKQCHSIPGCKFGSARPEYKAINSTSCACRWTEIDRTPGSGRPDCQPRSRTCDVGVEPEVDVDNCRPCKVGFYNNYGKFTMCRAWTNCANLGLKELIPGTNKMDATCGTVTDEDKFITTFTSAVRLLSPQEDLKTTTENLTTEIVRDAGDLTTVYETSTEVTRNTTKTNTQGAESLVIVVGVLSGIVVLLLVVLCFCLRKRKKNGRGREGDTADIELQAQLINGPLPNLDDNGHQDEPVGSITTPLATGDSVNPSIVSTVGSDSNGTIPTNIASGASSRSGLLEQVPKVEDLPKSVQEPDEEDDVAEDSICRNDMGYTDTEYHISVQPGFISDQSIEPYIQTIPKTLVHTLPKTTVATESSTDQNSQQIENVNEQLPGQVVEYSRLIPPLSFYASNRLPSILTTPDYKKPPVIAVVQPQPKVPPPDPVLEREPVENSDSSSSVDGGPSEQLLLVEEEQSDSEGVQEYQTNPVHIFTPPHLWEDDSLSEGLNTQSSSTGEDQSQQ